MFIWVEDHGIQFSLGIWYALTNLQKKSYSLCPTVWRDANELSSSDSAQLVLEFGQALIESSERLSLMLAHTRRTDVELVLI